MKQTIGSYGLLFFVIKKGISMSELVTAPPTGSNEAAFLNLGLGDDNFDLYVKTQVTNDEKPLAGLRGLLSALYGKDQSADLSVVITELWSNVGKYGCSSEEAGPGTIIVAIRSLGHSVVGFVAALDSSGDERGLDAMRTWLGDEGAGQEKSIEDVLASFNDSGFDDVSTEVDLQVPDTTQEGGRGLFMVRSLAETVSVQLRYDKEGHVIGKGVIAKVGVKAA